MAETLPMGATTTVWLVTTPVWFVIVVLAVVVAILAMLLWNLGVAQVGANKASVYVYFRLLFVAIGAMLILNEQLHAYHFAAFVLVAAGIWLVSRARTQPRAVSG